MAPRGPGGRGVPDLFGLYYSHFRDLEAHAIFRCPTTTPIPGLQKCENSVNQAPRQISIWLDKIWHEEYVCGKN